MGAGEEGTGSEVRSILVIVLWATPFLGKGSGFTM